MLGVQLTNVITILIIAIYNLPFKFKSKCQGMIRFNMYLLLRRIRVIISLSGVFIFVKISPISSYLDLYTQVPKSAV